MTKIDFSNQQFGLSLVTYTESNIKHMLDDIEDCKFFYIEKMTTGKHINSKRPHIHYALLIRIAEDKKYKNLEGMRRAIKKSCFSHLKDVCVKLGEPNEFFLGYPLKEYSDFSKVHDTPQTLPDDELDLIRDVGHRIYLASIKKKQYDEQSKLRSVNRFNTMEEYINENVDFDDDDLERVFCEIIVQMTIYYSIESPSNPKNIKGLSINIISRYFHKKKPRQLRQFILKQNHQLRLKLKD